MNRRNVLGIAGAAAAVLTACGKSSQKIRLALNWKPEPEFGPFYAAPYQKYGLDVEVLPGGAGTPTVQMVGASSAEFGIVSADELVVARSRGNDVVALFAVFQNNPQGIMVHASRKLTSIADFFRHPGTLAMQRGLSYARLLEKMYGFDKVKIVPSPNGDVSAFLHDKNFAQQCFITSEPLIAKRLGADVQVFPISDIGFNPYTDVMATSGDLLPGKPEMVKSPETVKSMAAAVREGLRSYLDDAKPTNLRMQQLNPTMPLDLFTETAEAQRPLIETEETRRNGLGSMTKERWATLIMQLKDLGDIENALAPEDCFRSL